ncbi:MAG: glycosyltransferase family 2 protein, partial [Xanthobacteraceae bacterium]
MPKISACVISFNDEHTIAWSVGSVTWVDEIVVVDTGSTDRTIEIAERLGARIVRTTPFAGFGEMRNRAMEHCRNDWVFSLDADEHCTRELEAEIKT